NVEKYIERCAESLFGQTLKEVEYIFVNDCTPDKSIDILNAVIERYPDRKDNVIIINNPQNLNVAVSRRIGLNAAKGEYIAWCDSDDWVEPAMLEQMYLQVGEKDADIVWSDFLWNEAGYIKQNFAEDKIKCIEQMCLTNMYWTLWNKLFRHTLFTDNNITIENFIVGEDMLVNLKLFYYAKRVTYFPQAFYHYNKAVNDALTDNLMTNPSKVLATIDVIKEIDNFYKGKRDFNLYKESITALKFWFKNDYLHAIFCKKDLKFWQNVFPECKNYIRRQPHLNCLQKIMFRLAGNKFLGWIVVCKNKIIKQYIKKK
ncbi:MAG: glycosyltransferase, partial [Bacteroidales bacterium]|nr:glycosyltransferase [Bacteroidales bacterium]